eukprot:TRINITY_DN10255_c0_g1_i1.p2 TRINITY_DN10255_c0_g1~~TRINITY_DN10255_c0_g1_i1.p2  ORF type:complete len:116 (+),score=20.72 TRINITY_DN10255_c0_g1_i1:43-348(+)
MMNDDGHLVDLYIPRKCSATNNLIPAKDHASVQFNVGNIDDFGVYTTGDYKTVAFCGVVRKMGGTDQAMNRIMVKDKVIKLTKAERDEKDRREEKEKTKRK